MNIITAMRYNIRYLKVVNSCDQKLYLAWVDDVLQIEGGFTSKLLVWNSVRGKEFYKTLSTKVAKLVGDIKKSPDIESATELAERAEAIIKIVMATEDRENVRRSFVWNVTKHAPILTADTLPYISAERLTHIIRHKAPITDEVVGPIVAEVDRLYNRLVELGDIEWLEANSQ